MRIIAAIVTGVIALSLFRPAPPLPDGSQTVAQGVEKVLSLTDTERAVTAIFGTLRTESTEEVTVIVEPPPPSSVDSPPEPAPPPSVDTGPIVTTNDQGPPIEHPKYATDVSDPSTTVLKRPNSLSPSEIDGILGEYGSPAVGTGQAFYDLGEKYGIDDAYAVAFFIHESSAGTAGGWAGLKPDGSTTHNIGNIICAGYSTCFGRFRDYGSWEEGIEDWYRLIDTEYIGDRGHQTVEDVIPVYAPAFENDVDGYTNVVSATVAGWRNAKASTEEASKNAPELVPITAEEATALVGQNSDRFSMGPDGPHGCPIDADGLVMTQGYGVGTHSPASVWGAVDLAVPGSAGQSVVAMHDGYVIASPNTQPAGNHIWVNGDNGWKTGYSHLASFTVESGQFVRAGEQIGVLGSTGMSSGPHLDLQVWHDGVNVDPTGLVDSGFR